MASELILTAEQRDAVRHDGHIRVDACPGSGKTRALIAKLVRCANEVRHSSRRIACITYTNAAVNEIEQRLRALGANGDDELCTVATVHAFCLQEVLRPYSWLIPELPNLIVVATDEDPEFISAAETALGSTPARSDLDAFGQLVRRIDGKAAAGKITDQKAQAFWLSLLSAGRLDFSSILYYTFRLLKEHSWIGEGMSARYAWCLVDEIQDTTSIQLNILWQICRHGTTKFFIVGDTLQSIYGFAGARLETIQAFSSRIQARTDISFLANFRSGPRVIDAAEGLFNRGMTARGKEQLGWPERVQQIHVDEPFQGIVDHFLPAVDALGIERGKCAVLAPSWFPLLPLGRKLRDYSVAVTGPGARPYKRRGNVFAEIAEQLCMVMTDGGESLLGLEKRVFLSLSDLTGRPAYSVYSYNGRRVLFDLVHMAQRIRDACSGQALYWLHESATAIGRIFVEAGWLPAEMANIFCESAKIMVEEMRSHRVDLRNLSVEDLGLFGSGHNSLRLMTMHAAKGCEFTAVALIDVHEGRIPHPYADVEESKRLFYVAVTRARRLLMIFTDSSDRRNLASRFIDELNL